MIITTKAVYDYAGNLIEWAGFEYSGPLAECKGDASKKEQAAADTARQAQFDLASKQLGKVDSAMQPFLNANQSVLANGGLTPEQQQAMQASLINNLGQTYQQGMGQFNQAMTARGLSGGMNAGGGAAGQMWGGLQQALGQQQQAGNASLWNAKMGSFQNALGNQASAAGLYGGLAGTFNQGGLNALNSGVTAANNVDQAQTSWMGPVFGGLTSLGSAGIGLAGKK